MGWMKKINIAGNNNNIILLTLDYAGEAVGIS